MAQLVAAVSAKRLGAEPMSTVSVRYFVDDVDAAVDFYTQHLSFVIAMCVDPIVRG